MLLSVSKGMELYLYIKKVYLEGNSRKVHYGYMKCMMLVSVDIHDVASLGMHVVFYNFCNDV